MKKFIANRLLSILCLITLLSSGFHVSGQTVYYVDSSSGNDAFSGTTWSSAFRNLTRAVSAANLSSSPVVEIWVAHGTYTPVDGIATLPSDARDTSFSFFRGDGVGKALKLYGGFAGTESSITDRDTSHATYLEGNFATSSFSYHVVIIAGLSTGADSVVVDGFTIRHGNAVISTSKTCNGVLINSRCGSGIYLSDNGSPKLALRNCRLITNYNAQKGGGIYISRSNPLIENCYFLSNTAIGAGAAIYNTNSTPRIIHSKFVSNSAVDYSLAAYGGAIYNVSSSPTISACTFTSNTVYGDGIMKGGAIYNLSSSDPLIDSCTFSANQASVTIGTSYGGAICNQASSPTITNCAFQENRSNGRAGNLYGPGPAYGGAIYDSGSRATINNCTFTNNVATGWGYMGSSSSSGYAYGGAICNISSTPSITNCSFSSDIAVGHMPPGLGPRAYAYGGGICNKSSSPIISGCTFNAESASADYGYGGAISSISLTAPITTSNCSFLNNTSTSEGGAIYQTLTKLTTRHCLFNNNSAKTGGAIALRYLYLMHYAGYDNVFSNNISTTNGGGAINIDNGGGTDTMINNLFVNNKDIGGLGGGAILITRGTHYLVNNTFFADSALSGGRGGAIHVVPVPGTHIFANNIFNDNYGTGVTSDTALEPIGTYTFSHNLYSTVDPLFLNPTNLIGADGIWRTADDGLQLARCSPARNSGLNSYVPTGITTDITGAARIGSAQVDMGAYETNPIGVITGSYDLCVGASETLSDTTSGGTWLSMNTAIATITSSGIVTGVSPGTCTILYVVAGLCSTDTAIATVVVTPATGPGTITGSLSVCVGTTTALSASVSGGTWSASNTNATVTGGIVTGVSTGTVHITYTNSCGTAFTYVTVTINTLPSAGTITGGSTVCVGASITLLTSVAGGAWSASSPTASVSGGTVTGVASGINTLSYTVTNSCGTSTATHSITVNPLPDAGIITGPDTVCIGSTETFINSTAGGIWSGSSIHSSLTSGIVSGLSAGRDTIYYTVINSCGNATISKNIQIADCSTSVLTPTYPGVSATIQVYPNPVNNYVVIKGAAGTTVTIFDATGKQVIKRQLRSDIEVVNTKLLVPGAHLLHFSDNNGLQQTGHIIKE